MKTFLLVMILLVMTEAKPRDWEKESQLGKNPRDGTGTLALKNSLGRVTRHDIGDEELIDALIERIGENEATLGKKQLERIAKLLQQVIGKLA